MDPINNIHLVWVDDEGIPSSRIQEAIPEITNIEHLRNWDDFLVAISRTVNNQRVLYVLDGAFPTSSNSRTLIEGAGYRIWKKALQENPLIKDRMISYCGQPGEAWPELWITEIGKYEGWVNALVFVLKMKIRDMS